MGSGKSTVGRLLAARGVAVIDTDDLARRVTAPGTPGHDAVLSHFGPVVAGPGGTLDRRALAGLVFNDDEQLHALEAITHPLITAELERRLAELDGRPFVVIEIPLLDARRRRDLRIDLVVVVDTKAEVAVRRAAGRGLSAKEVRARQRRQPSPEERLALADRVVVNSKSMSQLAGAVDELWSFLNDQVEPRPEPAGAADVPAGAPVAGPRARGEDAPA